MKQLLILAMILSFIKLNSQTTKKSNINNLTNIQFENIKLSLDIFINDTLAYDTLYFVNIVNLTTKNKYEAYTSNKVNINLSYNMNYLIAFDHPGCNRTSITVDTHAPFDNWLLEGRIKLYDKTHPNKWGGDIIYDTIVKSFIKTNLNTIKRLMPGK